MELFLSLEGVRKYENQDIATDKLVIINDFMNDQVIGHDSISQVIHYFCITDQKLNSIVPQFQQSLDDLQNLQSHFILFHVIFLIHLENGLNKAIEYTVLNEPDVHAIVFLVDIIICRLLRNQLIQELDAPTVDIRVRVIEQLQDWQKDLRLDEDWNVLL